MRRLLSALPTIALLLTVFTAEASIIDPSSGTTVRTEVAPGALATSSTTLPATLADVSGSGCSECKGGVVELTLQYTGSSTADIKVEDKDNAFRFSSVEPGGFFTLKGTEKDGKFDGNNLELFVNGSKVTEIHVSCSRPVNPGLSFGPFTIINAVSKDRGRVCPADGHDPDIDLEVEKEFDNAHSDLANGTLAYKVTVRNSSDADDAAWMVEVKDILPPFSTVVSADTPTGVTFSTSSSKWTIAVLEVGEEIELGIVVQLGVKSVGTRNCVEISDAIGDDIDSTPHNFSGDPAEDDEACADVPDLDLELTKTVSDESPTFGDQITYRITLRNRSHSASTAHNVTVAEHFPAGLEILDIDASHGSVDPTTLDWTVPSLAVGTSAILDITVLVEPEGTGSDLVTNGVYRLRDHPDGSAASPTYGLRLDKLFYTSKPVTFSFDEEDAEVWMQVSGSTVTIWGRVWGGRDAGSEYDANIAGYWDLFFEYDGVVSPLAGDDDLVASAASEMGGRGYITPLFSSDRFDAGERFDLAAHLTGDGTFFLGNEVDDDGHRGVDGLSGWGWLKHGQYGSLEHHPASDWLFTAELEKADAFKNCVQIWDADEADIDSNPGNGYKLGEDDDACVTVWVKTPLLDLAIQKEAVGYDSDTGEAEYRVTVYNQSTTTGTGIEVRDYLPDDAVFTQVISTTQGTVNALSDTEIEWIVGTIEGGATETQDEFTGPSATLVFRALIGPSLSTANTAEIFAADQPDIDSTPGNFFGTAGKTASKSGASMAGEDDDDGDAVPIVDLNLIKRVLGYDPVTRLAEFELSVTNNSPETATDVVVRDLLPFDAATELGSRADLVDAPGPVNAFNWLVGNVASNETKTTTVFVEIGPSNDTENCAEIESIGVTDDGRTIFDADSTPGNFDKDAGPQEDDEACTQQILIDLAVQKSADSYDSSTQEATYVVTVINEGFLVANGVVVTDYLPADALLDAASVTTTQGSFDGQDWTIGTLPINGFAELTYRARIGAAGDTKNCAEVTAAVEIDADSVPANFGGDMPAEDDEACDQLPLIDLRLEKVALEPTMVNAGQNVTFKLTVTNDGPADAVGVRVQDRLPAGLTVGSWTESQGSFDGGSQVWTIGDLAVGASADLLLTVETTEAGEYENCAEIKGAAPTDRDSVPANFDAAAGPQEDDESCAKIWVNDPRVDLKLRKTAAPTNANVGQTVTFTIEIENQSNVTATNVVVADYLPTDLEFVAARPALTAGLSWTIASLAPGEGRVFEVDATVKAAGELTNCAEIKYADQTDVDSTPANFDAATGPQEDDEACASIWTNDPKTDLKLIKTVDTNQVNVGDHVTYTLTLVNETAVAASGVMVADYLPSGLSIVDARPSLGDFSGTTWDVGYLAGNTTATLELDVKTYAAGEFENCAEIWDASPADRDSQPANFNQGIDEDDDSCVSIWVGDPKIDLRLDKTVSKSNVTVGSTVTYTLTVYNDGGKEATGIQVADYLPAGLTVTDVRPLQGYLNDLTWIVGSVGPYTSTSLELDVKVAAAGEYTNCAEIWDADQEDVDSIPGNFDRYKAPAEDDEACVSFWTSDPRIDLRLSKTVSKSDVKVGETVTYAIVVANDGPAHASGVVVADYLPSGLWLKGATTNQGSFDNGSWSVGYLSAGESARLELEVQIEVEGELTNCAEVWDASPEDKDSTPANFYRDVREDDEACVSLWSREVTGTNEITGYVFVDANENLYFDFGDYGQGGATVQLFRDLNDNDEVDSYDVFLEDVVTAYDGSYGFWIAEKGEFVLQVDASTLPDGANLLGGNAETASFSGFGQSDTDNNFPIVFMDPPVQDAMCYLVADNDGVGYDSPDVLTKLSTDASYEQVIGATYTDHIESIAFNPWTGVLYAADDRRLGTLDIVTGKFTEIGEFGGGEGAAGWRPFLDVDGLAFDPLSGELFATVRKVGEADFLIKVDPATGSFIPFGYGQDYLVISSPFGLQDIDDIAIDPIDGSIWAINNEDGEHSRLVKINRSTGVIEDVKPLPLDNVEGLGFFGDGTLYGTGGESMESIVVIDRYSLTAEVLLTIGTDGNRDYEAVDCLTNQTNAKTVSIYKDANSDGQISTGELGIAGLPVELYRDANSNGRVDFADRLVSVTTTGANGTARFATAANGGFVARVADAAMPLGSQVTSQTSTPVWFGGFGEVSDGGSIGVVMPAASSTSTANEDAATDVPTQFALNAAYPNPFNPETTIPFDLAETSSVRLAVYDVLGRQVSVLIDGVMSAGSHTARFDAAQLPSGMYLVQMQAGSQARSMMVTLLK